MLPPVGAYFFCVLACSAAEEKHSAADLLPVTRLAPSAAMDHNLTKNG